MTQARWATVATRGLAVVAALALATSACGGGSSSDSAGAAGGDAAPATTRVAVTFTPEDEVGAAGTPAPRPLAERTTVRVGLPVQVQAYGALFVGNELGEYDAENIDVEIVQASPSDLIVLMGQDKVDVALLGLDAGLLNAFRRDIDIRWVATVQGLAEDNTSGIYLSSGIVPPGQEPTADLLEGERVAVPLSGKGGSQIYELMEFLKGGGLTLDDIELAPLQQPDHVAALQSGAVVASGGIVEPFASQAAAGGAAILAQRSLTGHSSGGFFFSPEMTVGKRDLGVAFLRAALRTVRTYLQPGYQDDDEVVRAFSEGLSQDVDIVRATPPTLFSLAILPGSLDKLQGAWFEIGDVLEYQEPITDAEFIDQSLIAEAAG